MKRIAILVAACALFLGHAVTTTPGTAPAPRRLARRRPTTGRRPPDRLPAGQRSRQARPRRLHDQDRQPLLADLQGQAVGLPTPDERIVVTRHEQEEDGRGGRGGRSDRHRHQRRQRRLRRGHRGLVRAGHGRQRLVPRRGHQGVRERQGRVDHGLVGARRRRRLCRHHHAGRSRARPRVPPGVLRGRGGGRAQGPEPGRDREGPVRDLRELPQDRGHDAARARRGRVQVLREGRRSRAPHERRGRRA